MSGLNPKQAVMLFERVAVLKLAALRQLCNWLGLLPSSPMPQMGPIAAHWTDDAPSVLRRLCDPAAHPIARAAAALFLDVVTPEWRNHVGDEVLGLVCDRQSPELRKWRKAVLERDGHRCTQCDCPDNLHAHHIVRWVDAPHMRLLLSNGTTLCAACHEQAHASDKWRFKSRAK